MTRRRIFWATLVATVAGLVMVAPAVRRPDAVTLPDGSRLVLRAVEAGTNSSYFYGSFVSRIVRKLPIAVRSRFSAGQAVYHVFRETNLIVWLEHEPGIKGMRPRPNSLQFAVGEATGDVVAGPIQPNVYDSGAGPVGVALTAAHWPRRARRIVLRIYDPNLTSVSQLAGEFTLANPVYGPYPEWTPEPLPARRRLGDTLVTLDRFEVRRMPLIGRLLSRSNVLEWQALIQLQTMPELWLQAGPVRWELRSACLLDPTGNRTEWRPPDSIPLSRALPKNPIRISGLPVPWAGERILRLETRWSPMAAGRPSESVAAAGQDVQALIFTVAPDWRTNARPGR